MLLLAGDLFHHNRPSRASLYSTIASLREFCLNHRPIRVELIGDAGVGLPHGFKYVISYLQFLTPTPADCEKKNK